MIVVLHFLRILVRICVGVRMRPDRHDEPDDAPRDYMRGNVRGNMHDARDDGGHRGNMRQDRQDVLLRNLVLHLSLGLRILESWNLSSAP